MIRKLLLSIALIFSVSAFADEAQTTEETQVKEGAALTQSAKDFFEWEQISNLSQLDLNSPKLTYDAVTIGRFQLPEDFITNLMLKITGTARLPEGFVADLKEQGFDKAVEQSFLFKWLDDNRNYALTIIFGCAGLILIIWGIFHFSRGKDWDDVMTLIATKLVIVGISSGILFFFKTFIVIGVLTVNGYANKFLLTLTVQQSVANFSSVPSATDKYTIAANSNNMTEIALSILKTRQAKLQLNMANIAERDRWFVNFAGGYTVEEALEKFNEFQQLKISAENDGWFNIDMTTSLSNIVNLYKISRSVNITRNTGDYSVDERKVYGFESLYGTVEINANAESFEQSTNTSVNDGTLIKQIQAVVDNAASNSNNIILNTANKASAVLIPLMQNGNVNSSSLYEDAANYPGLGELKESVKAYAKKFTKEQVTAVKMDEIGSTTPESRIVLSGLVTSAVMAGVQGADKSGALTRNQLKYFLKIAEAQINKECTEHWSDVRANKQNVEKINAAMDQDAKTFLAKGMTNVQFKCAFLRENDNTVIALGSDKPEDALMYKAQVMAYKAAYDFAVLAFMEGVKEYINEDQTYLQALVGASLRNVKLGLVGYALDGSARSRIQGSIAKRDAFISNAIHVRVNDQIVKSPTKVNTEDLWNAKDLEADDEKSKQLATYFYPVDMKYAYLQSVVNITALTPESDSSMADKLSSMMTSLIANLVGIPTDSLKVLGRLDPNLSIYDGAKACLKDPIPCYMRPKANLLAETANMGDELISYSLKVFVINSVLHLAADTVDGFADLAENLTNGTASVGSDKKEMGAIAKVIVGSGAKLVKIFVAAATSATEALKPIAIILLGAGVIMKYILPWLPAFILTNVLIKFLVNIVGFQNLYGPYYIIRMLVAGNIQTFWEQTGALVNAIISLLILVAVYAFLTAFVYVALDIIDVAPLLWHILGGSDLGIIGSLMAAVVGMVMCAFMIHSIFKNIFGVGEQLMHKFEYNSSVDQEIQRVAKTLFDSRAVDAIRIMSSESNNFIDSTQIKSKSERAYARENAKEDRKKIRDSAKKFGSQGLKSSNENQ
ncbi:hypothetical protein ACXM5X_31645 [Pseudomonas saponiphila]